MSNTAVFDQSATKSFVQSACKARNRPKNLTTEWHEIIRVKWDAYEAYLHADLNGNGVFHPAPYKDAVDLCIAQSFDSVPDPSANNAIASVICFNQPSGVYPPFTTLQSGFSAAAFDLEPLFEVRLGASARMVDTIWPTPFINGHFFTGQGLGYGGASFWFYAPKPYGAGLGAPYDTGNGGQENKIIAQRSRIKLDGTQSGYMAEAVIIFEASPPFNSSPGYSGAYHLDSVNFVGAIAIPAGSWIECPFPNPGGSTYPSGASAAGLVRWIWFGETPAQWETRTGIPMANKP